MLIAVMSDTHGSSVNIERALEQCENADVLIHLGDVVSDIEYIKRRFNNRIIHVPGNCDYDCFGEREKLVEIKGVKILLCHGDRYRVNMGLISLKYRARECGAKIALFGHTHKSLVVEEDGILFMNPGSTSMPRDLNRSIGFIEIDECDINAYIKTL